MKSENSQQTIRIIGLPLSSLKVNPTSLNIAVSPCIINHKIFRVDGRLIVNVFNNKLPHFRFTGDKLANHLAVMLTVYKTWFSGEQIHIGLCSNVFAMTLLRSTFNDLIDALEKSPEHGNQLKYRYFNVVCKFPESGKNAIKNRAKSHEYQKHFKR